MGKWPLMPEHILTQDGSHTLFSSKYNQHFHDIKTGAIKESMSKHVIPAFEYHKDKKELNILDICFGIGYNTFSTIYYVLRNKLDVRLNIYSPELDAELINSLHDFNFPEEFKDIKHIIQSISKDKKYKDDFFDIEVKICDARKYIKTLKNMDIVYQDAFSSDVNNELWTVEYFKDIHEACNKDAIVTTYSIATPVRLSMYKAGFEIYEIKPVKMKQTLGFKHKISIDAKYIDMELKQQRNKEAKAIYD